MDPLIVILVVVVLGLVGVAVATAGRSRRPIKEYAQQGRSQMSMSPSSESMAPIPDTCLRCHGPLDSVGVEQFRIGGTSGGWKLLFGEWAELGEDKVPLDVYVCRRCRRVEFRMP